MSNNAFDAVVIGGGHNGLAAAVHLAKRGMSVVVLERSDRPGGAVATAEVTLPGFRHDLYAMNLSLFAGSPFAATYGQDLARHGLEYAPATDCFATPFADGRWLGISADMETNAERIGAFSADDAARWREMSAAFGGDAQYYFALLGAPMGARSLLRTAMSTLKAKGSAWTVDAVKLLLSSPREFLDSSFVSPQLKAVLAPWAMHLDFPPDASGGALFPYLEAMADQAFGMALGKGGADVVPKALTGVLQEAGGVIRVGAHVEAVEQSAGRAVGVRLDTGETIAAREAVLASVTPKGLLSLLGGSTGVPSKDAALRAFQHGPGTMMIHVAASALPDWTAGDALKTFAYVHLAPDLASLSTTYASAMEGVLPAEPAIVVGQPTAIDPTRAPDGQHALWIQVRVVPSVATADALGEIAPGPWEGIKEAMAERVMAIIERYAPGFSANVLARTVDSPADLEAANINLIGGCSLGGSHHLRQNFVFRPAFGMSQYKTPVKALYMIGSSTWPGAGLGAGSGFMAAKMIARG